MTTPLFSVVIPLYNKADTIARTLRSVAAQTFHDYEVVVVDDGSKDKGAAIVSSFKGIARLRLISQSNAGVSVARNNGVDAAQGRFIAFLDADDEWMPTFLEEINRLAQAYPEAKVLGSGYERRCAGKTYICRSRRKPFICDLFKVWAFFQPMNSSSIVVEKTAYLEVGGYPVGVAFWEDAVLWFRLANRYRYYIVRKPLSRYNDDAEIKATGATGGRGTCRDRMPHLALLEQKIEDGIATTREDYCAVVTLRKMLTENLLHFGVIKNRELLLGFPATAGKMMLNRFYQNACLWPLMFPLAVLNGIWIRIRLRLWFKKVNRG